MEGKKIHFDIRRESKRLDTRGIEPRTAHNAENRSYCEARIIPLDHAPVLIENDGDCLHQEPTRKLGMRVYRENERCRSKAFTVTEKVAASSDVRDEEGAG